MSSLYIFLIASVPYVTAMPPRMNLATLKAMEVDAAAAQAVGRQKKRPVVEAGQYELKGIRKGLQIELVGQETTRTRVEAGPSASQGDIPIGIPLVKVVGTRPVVTTQ